MEKQCGVIWLGDRNRRNAQPIKYEVLHSGGYKVVGRELDSRGCCQVRANGSQKSRTAQYESILTVKYLTV